MSYAQLAVPTMMLFLLIIYIWLTKISPLLKEFAIERTEILIAGISLFAPYIDTFILKILEDVGFKINSVRPELVEGWLQNTLHGSPFDRLGTIGTHHER